MENTATEVTVQMTKSEAQLLLNAIDQLITELGEPMKNYHPVVKLQYEREKLLKIIEQAS